jgi:hypothetical protein
LRRACPQGVIMGAHSTGRVVEALAGGRSGTARGARDPSPS